jgi:hypothetical protein
MVAGKSHLHLRNGMDKVRYAEPVVIGRAELVKEHGDGAPGTVLVLKYTDGRLIPSQLDDLDGDGRWDELAFEVDMEANGRLKISLEWVPAAEAPAQEQWTQVYLGKLNTDGTFTEVHDAEAPIGLEGFPAKYQSEGVGWENDKMAFRVYFDCRNVKDLFGKLEPGLILQNAGKPEFGSYHELAPWGMDILHCGSSLGAGGLALVDGDSLYRLGSTPDYRYHEICEGPVRCIFELRYSGWQVAGNSLEAVERITLWAGKQWFQSEVKVNGFAGEKGLATGIVTTKLKGQPEPFRADAGHEALMTHGIQSLNDDVLAMAVMAPVDGFVRTARTSATDYYKLGYRTVPEKSFSIVVSETAFLEQKIKSGTPALHWYFAFWGLANRRWNSDAAVKEYICTEAERLSNPLVIKH